MLSGVSLDVTCFFYIRSAVPVKGPSHGKSGSAFPVARPNLARLLALARPVISIPRVTARWPSTSMFRAAFEVDVHGQVVTLRQEADYPWTGRSRLRSPSAARLTSRCICAFPAGVAEAALLVNGEALGSGAFRC